MNSSAPVHGPKYPCSIPFRLFFLQRRHTQKFVYGCLGVVSLQLLRIVVLVLDIDIAALLVIVVLVFEVVPAKS
jgi:hypothetical protein